MKITALAAVLMLLSFGGTALADTGGEPNENAQPTADSLGNGRKAGDCGPPGALFEDFAKLPGPITAVLGIPGKENVVPECGLGNPS